MPRIRKRRVHYIGKPIPPRVWKIDAGWWLSLRRFDGTKLVRTGFRNREEAMAEAKEALKGGVFESAWYGMITEKLAKR